jgi:hypothetical protein
MSRPGPSLHGPRSRPLTEAGIRIGQDMDQRPVTRCQLLRRRACPRYERGRIRRPMEPGGAATSPRYSTARTSISWVAEHDAIVDRLADQSARDGRDIGDLVAGERHPGTERDRVALDRIRRRLSSPETLREIPHRAAPTASSANRPEPELTPTALQAAIPCRILLPARSIGASTSLRSRAPPAEPKRILTKRMSASPASWRVRE